GRRLIRGAWLTSSSDWLTNSVQPWPLCPFDLQRGCPGLATAKQQDGPLLSRNLELNRFALQLLFRRQQISWLPAFGERPFQALFVSLHASKKIDRHIRRNRNGHSLLVAGRVDRDQ